MRNDIVVVKVIFVAELQTNWWHKMVCRSRSDNHVGGGGAGEVVLRRHSVIGGVSPLIN